MSTSRRRSALAAGACLLVLTGCAGTTGAGKGPDPVTAPVAARLVADGTHCPPTDAGARSVVFRGRDRESLLPSGFRSQRVLVCRYSAALGRSPRRGALAREVALTGRGAAAVTRAAAAVELRHLSGPVACPADFATAIVLAFEPRRGRPVDLWWTTSGCQALDDGVVRTTALANPSFWRFRSAVARAIRTADPQDRPERPVLRRLHRSACARSPVRSTIRGDRPLHDRSRLVPGGC